MENQGEIGVEPIPSAFRQAALVVKNGGGITVFLSLFEIQQLNRHLPVFLSEPVFMESIVSLPGIDVLSSTGQEEKIFLIGHGGEQTFQVRMLNSSSINPKSLFQGKTRTVLWISHQDKWKNQ
jgi:hypothetical protein